MPNRLLVSWVARLERRGRVPSTIFVPENGGTGMAQSVCVVGGGASALGLVWSIAKAKQQGKFSDELEITILHSDPQLGGHSASVAVPYQGQNVMLDLGVQMIAPAMYPNLVSMLELPEFAGVELQPVPLKITCAFPPVGGATPYWGNFADDQSTPLWQQGAVDCSTFERLLSLDRYLPIAMSDFLSANSSEFRDLQLFENYFLDPYMSIMNGYGSALLDQLYVPEVAFLFDNSYASFTNWSSDFARFKDGSVAWINAMQAFAMGQLGSDLTIDCNVTATQVYPAGDQVEVTWSHNLSGVEEGALFDMVVITVDQATCGQLLDNSANQQSGLWSFFEQYVGQSVWNLQPGYCYLHQDESILAPGIVAAGEETLQFTAYWATQQSPYDLTYSFTTYIESNLVGIEDPAFNYYLTMYGFDPTQPSPVPVPIPSNPIQPTPMNWTHGMWMPMFSFHAKETFHQAQSVSPIRQPLDGQRRTNIFFAGNNLTMDSEEGALVSGLAIAEYVFGIPVADLITEVSHSALSRAMYLALFELMFPGIVDASSSTVPLLAAMQRRP